MERRQNGKDDDQTKGLNLLPFTLTEVRSLTVSLNMDGGKHIRDCLYTDELRTMSQPLCFNNNNNKKKN